MRILLFLNKDLEANIAYNLLKEELLKHQCKVWFSESVGKNEAKPSGLKLLEQYEKEYFFNEIRTLMKNQNPDSEFEFIGDSNSSFPMEKCDNVNSESFIREVTLFQPDLFISIRFGKIFRNEILKIPSKGVINLHSGLLPAYRGILGTLHALKNGESHYGCTLHTIPDDGIDTGEIIQIAKLPVDREKSLFWHILQLYPAGVKMIMECMEQFKNEQNIECFPQKNEESKYYSLPSESDFELLISQGFEIFSKEDYCEIVSQYLNLERDMIFPK